MNDDPLEDILEMILDPNHLWLGPEYLEYLPEYAPVLARAVRDLQRSLVVAQQAAEELAGRQSIDCIKVSTALTSAFYPDECSNDKEDDYFDQCEICLLAQAYAVAEEATR